MEKENKMTIKKDLLAISKELTKLVKQTEKLAATLDKAVKPKSKPAKKKAKAKVVVKKAPAKAAKKTDTDKVFAIINRSKKGVDTAALMKKSGFDRKKIANMVYKLGKQGKIKSIQKGVYLKA